MKRWLFDLAAAFSLLLSLAAAASWATSYAPPHEWRLLGVAHSADMKHVQPGRGVAAVAMRRVSGSSAARYGFWDASWLLSRSGRLTVVAHALDYEGPVRAIDAAPPSVIVQPSESERGPLVAFAQLPESHPWARKWGFAWDSDAQEAVDGGGATVAIRARMITLPHWLFVVLGVPLPLRWLRLRRRRQ